MKTKDWIIAVSVTMVGTVVAAVVVYALKEWKTKRDREKLTKDAAAARAVAQQSAEGETEQ